MLENMSSLRDEVYPFISTVQDTEILRIAKTLLSVVFILNESPFRSFGNEMVSNKLEFDLVETRQDES